MEYIYLESDKYDKKLKNDEYSCLSYYSKKAIKKKYPRGEYTVIGGIGEGSKKKYGEYFYLKERHSFYTLHYPKWKYGIDGYIDVGNDQYIAIVKKRLLRNCAIFSFLILALVGIITGGILLFSSDGLDPSAKDFTPTNIDVNTDPNHIALPGYDSINVKVGSNTSYTALWNPPNNPCYFKFTILMDEKEIYKTGLIEPGKAITEIKFNRTFKKGVYPITIKIDTFDLKEKDQKLNGGVIETNLIAIE